MSVFSRIGSFSKALEHSAIIILRIVRTSSSKPSSFLLEEKGIITAVLLILLHILVGIQQVNELSQEKSHDS